MIKCPLLFTYVKHCARVLQRTSQWDRLPPEIERTIAMFLVARIVEVNGTGIEGDMRPGVMEPHGEGREQNLQCLRAWRLMRKSLSIALRPIYLLYKPIQSANHANAFVKGFLLKKSHASLPCGHHASYEKNGETYLKAGRGCFSRNLKLNDMHTPLP